MPALSPKSQKLLMDCHNDLRLLFGRVSNTYEFQVLESYRDQKRQDELFKLGKTKLKFPESRHNVMPAKAVDIIPLYKGKSDWKDMALFYHFAGFVMGVASEMKIKIRWGGQFSSNHSLKDQPFIDCSHWEIL